MLSFKSKFEVMALQNQIDFNESFILNKTFSFYNFLFCLFRVTEDFKINPGAVEAIAEQPGNPDNILIGYNRGLVVLWNRAASSADQVLYKIVPP